MCREHQNLVVDVSAIRSSSRCSTAERRDASNDDKRNNRRPRRAASRVVGFGKPPKLDAVSRREGDSGQRRRSKTGGQSNVTQGRIAAQFNIHRESKKQDT